MGCRSSPFSHAGSLSLAPAHSRSGSLLLLPCRRAFVVSAASPSPSGDKPLTVAIAGATGLIGTALIARLLSEGATVKVLTRSVDKAREALARRKLLSGVSLIVDPGRWAEAIGGCDAVVNLAGEPIATRWSPEIRRSIKDSRVYATHTLSAALNATPLARRPKVFVSSSAVGYYGSWPDSANPPPCGEDAPAGSDFLAGVCVAWVRPAPLAGRDRLVGHALRGPQPCPPANASPLPPLQEAAAREAKNVRVVIIRTGIILDSQGGALAKMMPIFQLGFGGPPGSGKQFFSWVALEDEVSLIVEVNCAGGAAACVGQSLSSARASRCALLSPGPAALASCRPSFKRA